MSKLLAVAAGLKAAALAAGIALARGDMLPVILISLVFNLVQLGAKPPSQAVPDEASVVSRGRITAPNS